MSITRIVVRSGYILRGESLIFHKGFSTKRNETPPLKSGFRRAFFCSSHGTDEMRRRLDSRCLFKYRQQAKIRSHRKSSSMKIILCIVSVILEFSTVMATQRQVPSQYSTIQSAINAGTTLSGDTIAIATGIYNESLSVNKSVTLLGARSSVVITPTSGVGITVTANNVLLQSLRVTHSHSIGISASNFSNLTLTNVSCDSNKIHGLSIGSASLNVSNIIVNGGSFSGNGTGRDDGTGVGININANGSLISNIFINGPLTASNNTTAGIWINTTSTTDSVKTVTVGASGTITLTNNGGSGVILFGNVKDAMITGNFTKGAAFAAGILVVGNGNYSPYSPINTVIKNCTFNAGYNSSQPAISLYDGIFNSSINGVLADSDLFLGTNSAGIDSLIYDQLDDSWLGLVTLQGDNALLPIELTNFTASAHGRQIELHWATATEVNNYGFEVERKAMSNEQSTMNIWTRVAFVQGHGTTSSPQLYKYNDAVQSSGKFQYRLKQIDHDGNFVYGPTVEVSVTLTPDDYALSQNFPNPFNPSTKIQFALATTQFAEVKVFNSLGEEVKTLFSGVGEAGVVNEVQFDGKEFASGVYFYSLTANGRHEIKKMVLLR